MTAGTNYSGRDGVPDETAKLVALSGRKKGSIYRLPSTGEVVIGRADTSDIIVSDDIEVSRQHCRIVADGGVYRIEDAGSRNGSFLDGQLVKAATLYAGAKIRVGQTTFTFLVPEAERKPTVAGAPVPPAPSEPRSAEAAEPAPTARRRNRLRALAAMAALAALAALAAFATSFGPRLLGDGTRIIRIDSTPARAEVFVDDHFVALTPTEVKVSKRGLQVLRVTKHGYLTERSRIGPDTPPVLFINLRPEPAATLFISASQTDTDVFLNGLFVGRTGPEQPLRIPSVRLGQHELRLQRPNYLPHQQQLEITSVGNISIHAKLESREEASLLSLIAEQPNSALLFTELGHLRMVDKQFDAAIEAYRKAFELVHGGRDSTNYGNRLNEEFQKLITGRLFQYGTEAEMQVVCRKLEDMFVSLAPQYREACARLAQLGEHYANKNLVDDAIRVYRKMLTAHPNDLNLYYRVAALCASRNDHEASIAILRQAADRFPNNWSVLYRLGVACLQRAAADLSETDKEKAVFYLEKALALCTSDQNKRTIEYHLTKARELKF